MPCFLYKYIDYIRVIQPKSPEMDEDEEEGKQNNKPTLWNEFL